METTKTATYSEPAFEVRVRHFPVKRTFDILFSICALIVASPLFFLIALAIRLTSKGPVFFTHTRVGRGGKLFRIYKFRTMYCDADARLHDHLASNPAAREEWERVHKLKNDPRVTSIGRLLRISSLDELPQFFNVLKGDLSVVGPRPVLRHELERFYGPIAPKVLSIRPGITGLWQVSGRSNLSYQQRVELDEAYVDSRNLGLDLLLILKTIPAMISRRGAY